MTMTNKELLKAARSHSQPAAVLVQLLADALKRTEDEVHRMHRAADAILRCKGKCHLEKPWARAKFAGQTTDPICPQCIGRMCDALQSLIECDLYNGPGL